MPSEDLRPQRASFASPDQGRQDGLLRLPRSRTARRPGNLKEATINLVCYKCHAEKQGPFAFEHPPVRENCCICHNPHGAVANNLLKQPATFLCLRCHAGHNGLHRTGQPKNPAIQVQPSRAIRVDRR